MNIFQYILTVALLAGATASSSAESVTDTWNFNKPVTGHYKGSFYLSTDKSSADYYGNYLPEGWLILGPSGWKINIDKNGVDGKPCLEALETNYTNKAIVFYAHQGTLGFNMKARASYSTYSVIRLFDATPDEDTYTVGDLAVMKEVEDLSATDYKVIDIEVPADGYYALTITGLQYINDISNTYEVTPSTFNAGGIVTDEAQTPLEGVAVKIGEANTSTDAEGKWNVSGLLDGSYTAEFSKTGYVSESTSFDIEGADKSDISVVLKPMMLSFTARVMGGENALTGATVTLTDPDSNVVTVPESETVGVYMLSDIDAVVAADKPYIVSIKHPLYENESASVVFDYKDIDNTYTLIRKAPTRFGGKVTDKNSGEPLAGVEITLVDDAEFSANATSGEDGSYKFDIEDVPAASYTLTATMPGYDTIETTVSNVEISGKYTVNFELVRVETVLTGTVTASENATPLEGVEITFVSKDDKTVKYVALTDEKGVYVITLKGVIAETYELTATCDGYLDHTAEVSSLKYGEENTLSFSMNIDNVGVKEIYDTQRKAETFSIDGRRIQAGATLTPGIYIIDGRKVVVR